MIASCFFKGRFPSCYPHMSDVLPSIVVLKLNINHFYNFTYYFPPHAQPIVGASVGRTSTSSMGSSNFNTHFIHLFGGK